MKSNLLLILAACLISFTSCTKDTEDCASVSDNTLSSMSTSDDLVVQRTIQNDEGSWNIKMNSIAAKAYAEGLKTYPVNSMIVKEKRDANGNVLRYAVMYNAPNDPSAVDGWLWSEYDAERHVIYSTAERSMSCNSCHGQMVRNQ